MKISLESLMSRITPAEDRISEFKDESQKSSTMKNKKYSQNNQMEGGKIFKIDKKNYKYNTQINKNKITIIEIPREPGRIPL